MKVYDELKIPAKLYKGILTGLGGLIYYGRTNIYPNHFEFAVSDKNLDGVRLKGAKFVYVDNIDDKNLLVPNKYNPEILIPTLERALVDHMRFGAITEDDENLMTALQYYGDENEGDFSKLLKVADFYNVKEQMIKAIELSKEWDSEY